MRSRLTFANVVSCLALFVALGGSAYAVTQLPKNSVGSRQIKKGAVTKAKISKSTRTALIGSKGPQGEQGPPGTPATALFAQVTADGTVQTSGTPVTAKKVGIGYYVVRFGREITGCAAIASQGGIPIFGTPGTGTAAPSGEAALVHIFSPDPANEESVPGFPIAQTVYVNTYSGSAPSDSSFHIAVLC